MTDTGINSDPRFPIGSHVYMSTLGWDGIVISDPGNAIFAEYGGPMSAFRKYGREHFLLRGFQTDFEGDPTDPPSKFIVVQGIGDHERDAHYVNVDHDGVVLFDHADLPTGYDDWSSSSK